MSSNERFGYEWDKYSVIDPNYEKQFKNWIHPVEPDDFKGKEVLDAGCGMGRNSYWPLLWGAKRVLGFDFDHRSVNAARKNLANFQNAEVQYKSIYDIQWKREFDVAFCIGVIHHLKEPKFALKKLVESLKPNGTLIIWVYSYEGNEWIVRFVSPIRKLVTSKLPVGLVHVLSYAFSIPLYAFVKIFKGPSAYFKQLSTFHFWHVHSIVFDQLIPDVANYWKREEVKELFSHIGLREFAIYQPPNKTGWTIVGKTD